MKKDLTTLALLRNAMSASLVLQCAGLGLLLLAQILIARLVGAADFGVYSYSIACATAAITIAKYGTDTMVYRYGGRYFSGKDWSKFKGLLIYSRRLIVRSSIFACVLLFCYALFLFSQKQDFSLSTSIVLAALAVPVVAASTLRQTSLVAINDVVRGLAPEHLVRTLSLILGALALGIAGLATAESMVLANVASYLASFAVGQYWLKRSIVGRSVAQPDMGEMDGWANAARGLLLFSVAFQLLTQYDLLVVGYLLDSVSTGVYAAARQIASVGVLGLIAFQLVASPRIASAHARNEKGEFASLTSAVALGGVCFTLVYGIFVVLAGPLVLGLLGPEFRDGQSVMLWLIGAQFVNAASGPAGTVAAMLGLHFGATVVYLAALAGGCSSLFLLLPRFGINGAAISVLIATTIWCVAMNLLLYLRAGSSVWLGKRRYLGT